MRRKRVVSENLQNVDYPRHRVDLYRQAARDVQASDSGIARYVISLFGPDLIGSLALAIDPFRQFRNEVRNVSLLTDGPKIVRTRSIVTTPYAIRRERWTITTVSTSYIHNPDGGVFDYLYTDPVTETTTGTITNSPQEKLYGLIIDTTRRTRPIKCIGGEFEYFAPKLDSRSRSHSFLKTDRLVYNSIGSGQRSTVRTRVRSEIDGPEYTVSNSGVQGMLPAIRARADAAMLKHVYGMLDEVLPRHRTYNLYYQVAELRETSLTLKNSLQAWLAFERLIGTTMFRQLQQTSFRHLWRNPHLLSSYHRTLGRSTGFRFNELEDIDVQASSAFLTFKFGWESTWRGISQFLPSANRATRQVNFLVDRIGTEQSFRTRKSWSENETSFPTFSSLDFLKNETVISSSKEKSGRRDCELRLMVNLTLRFPHLDLPRLRAQLFREKMGAFPSASDLYNLIPWTWLVDWFGGLGDYISLMGTIANDPSIINYGFITYREVSTSTVTMKGKFTTQYSRSIDGVDMNLSTDEFYYHPGTFKYVYQRRRSIPSLTNVKSYWGSNLNANQSAIIGALLSTKGGSAARRDAS